MRARLLVTFAVMMLAGCSEPSTELAVITPSPSGARISPTPTPAPSPTATPSEQELLVAACYGKSVPGTAPYSGKVHPLVVAGPWGGDQWDWLPDIVDINGKWRDGLWTTDMIQLVICPGKDENARGPSCGTYKNGDGVRGELSQVKVKQPIRVVIATTGKTLQTKTLYGPVDACPSTAYVPKAAPPWLILGDSPTPEQINIYATAVSRQIVK